MERMRSPEANPAFAAAPPSATATSGEKAGTTPMEGAIAPSAFTGTTWTLRVAPPRSTSRSTGAPPMVAYMRSSKVRTRFPPDPTTRSPGRIPASQAGPPWATAPTTAGVASTPARKEAAKRRKPSTAFMTTPAIMMMARFQTGFAGKSSGAKPPPGSSFSPLIFT